MNNNQSSANTSGGITFCGLLTLVFIALKLLGQISWSWLWVLAPMWIPLAVAVMILIVIAIVVAVKRL